MRTSGAAMLPRNPQRYSCGGGPLLRHLALGRCQPAQPLAIQIQGVGQQQHLPQAGDVAALFQDDVFLESQAGGAGDLQL